MAPARDGSVFFVLKNGGVNGKYINLKKALDLSEKHCTFAAELRFIRESRLRSA